jgi:thiol-disulfide isomerase/thioredoxin
MKNRLILVTGILIAALIGGYFYKKYRIAPAIEFQNLQFVTLDGQKATLKDYESRYMLVCFAATWCQPCLNEIPSLIKAQELLAENDVAVILISDESEEAVMSLWKRTHESLPVLRSESKFRELKIATLPTTYLLNPSREIVFKKTGAEDWANPMVIENLKSLSR